MRKIVSAVYLTLDGVMQDPGGQDKAIFPQGGWSFPFFGDDIAAYKSEELFSCEALLLGRVTYEGFSKAWPTMADAEDPGLREFAARMNSMPKYVASHTLTEATWNASILEGDAVEAVKALKADSGGDILLAASADFSQPLMREGLIDEYRLLVHPVVVGAGRRFFHDGTAMQTLRLIETRPFASGVLLMTYGLATAAA